MVRCRSSVVCGTWTSCDASTHSSRGCGAGAGGVGGRVPDGAVRAGGGWGIQPVAWAGDLASVPVCGGSVSAGEARDPVVLRADDFGGDGVAVVVDVELRGRVGRVGGAGGWGAGG